MPETETARPGLNRAGQDDQAASESIDLNGNADTATCASRYTQGDWIYRGPGCAGSRPETQGVHVIPAVGYLSVAVNGALVVYLWFSWSTPLNLLGVGLGAWSGNRSLRFEHRMVRDWTERI